MADLLLIVSRPYLLLSPSAKDEVTRTLSGCDPLEDFVSDSAYDSVIVGLAPEMFDYSHLNTAFRILKGETAQSELQRLTANRSRFSAGPTPLVATHMAKYIQTDNPPGLSLGPGPFVSALETAAGVQAHVIGKPTRLFFQTVIDDFYASGELEQTAQSGRIAVIGDDVEADLGDGAVQMGLWRILGEFINLPYPWFLSCWTCNRFL
jgi:ribonucleotide monophosphatase NagD (HAD superfamily)